jgi:hypothetical protein
MASDAADAANLLLLADDPIASGAKDSFDRVDFANRVAELVDRVAGETPSAVFGLLGPWGSGKTSTLHLVEEALRREYGGWAVISFNPWEVAELHALVSEFLVTIRSVLPDSAKGKTAREAMSGYISKVAPVGDLFKIFGVDAGGALRGLAEASAGDQSLDARRKALEAALIETDTRVLVLVDDVDRLHPEELTLLFKLVRLVGRLPNVHYLLAFDEQTVLDVLQRTGLAYEDEKRALSYIEKMVQLRLDLPPLHPVTATHVVDQAIGLLAEEFGVTVTDDDMHRFSPPYYAHMTRHLREPRQIKRFFGQVEAMYPLVQGNVDFIDFLLITFVRTVHPGVYRRLVTHKDELTGTPYDLKDQPFSERLNDWRARLAKDGTPDDDISGLLEVLGAMFIPIAEAIGNGPRGGTAYDRLAAARRIGSGLYFDWYFYLAPTPGDVPDDVIAAALAEVLAGVAGSAVTAVAGAVATAPQSILDRIARALPSDPGSRRALVPFVAMLAHQVPEQSGVLGSTSLVGEFLVADLLRTSALDDPSALAAEIAEAAGAALLAEVAVHALQSYERESAEVPKAFAEFLKEVPPIIEAALNREAVMPVEDTHEVLAMLFRWRDLAGEDAPRGWLQAHLDSGGWSSGDFVGLFVPLATSYGEGAPRKSFGDLSLASLDTLLGLENVIGRLELDNDAQTDDDHPKVGDVSFAARVKAARSAIRQYRERVQRDEGS